MNLGECIQRHQEFYKIRSDELEAQTASEDENVDNEVENKKEEK